MWKQVKDYALYWAPADRAGIIYLKLSDGTEGTLKHLSRDDLSAFAAILHREEVIWYHSTRGDLSTEKVPRDEEERM